MRVLAIPVPAVYAWGLVHLGRTHEADSAVPNWLSEESLDSYRLAFWARPYRNRDDAVRDARELARVGLLGRRPRQTGGVWSFRQGLVVHRLDLARLPEGRFVALAQRSPCLDLIKVRPLAGPTYAWPSDRPWPLPSKWLPQDIADEVLAQLQVERGVRDMGQLSLLAGQAC